jgi:hypothetical protein
MAELEHIAPITKRIMDSMKRKTIPCQTPHVDSGCYTCGGYGYLFEFVEVCRKCRRSAWLRPGNFTCYEGKKFNSMDGVTLTCHMDDSGVWYECHGCVGK